MVGKLKEIFFILIIVFTISLIIYYESKKFFSKSSTFNDEYMIGNNCFIPIPHRLHSKMFQNEKIIKI